MLDNPHHHEKLLPHRNRNSVYWVECDYDVDLASSRCRVNARFAFCLCIRVAEFSYNWHGNWVGESLQYGFKDNQWWFCHIPNSYDLLLSFR
jgi:hypothetical protein